MTWRAFGMTIFAAVLLEIAAPASAFGPVAPTDAVMPKTKGINKVIPDLPYKPQNPDGDPGTFPVSGDASKSPEGDNDIGTNKTSGEVIDWANIPFIPSKRIELGPAPDPGIE